MDGTSRSAGIRYPWEDPPAPGEAIEVAENILWLRLPLPMRLDHVNLYALDEGDSWTLIDAGMATGKARAELEQLRKGPLGGKPISRVVLTHHLPDHVGFVGSLKAEGAEIVATRTAWLTARMLTLDVEESYPTETVDFYRKAGMAPEVLEARQNERPFNFADIVEHIPLGYTRIRQGDSIQMGGRTWDVEIGDGHAPEHATFWCRDSQLVLGGDQLLPSISPNIGVYPTEPEADPLGDWLASCRRFAEIAKDEHLVLGGHKLPYRGLPTRLAQLIENHEGVLDRLRDFLRQPATAGQTFDVIFKRVIGSGEYGLALVEALAHCQHLYHLGEVDRHTDDTGAWRYKTR